MAQVTELQASGLPGVVHVFSAKTEAVGVAYTSCGVPFLYTAANWGTVDIYLEAYFKASSGSVYARLYDVTGAAEVANSEISTAETSLTRIRSSALTLTDAHVYILQTGTNGAGEINGGQLIVI